MLFALKLISFIAGTFLLTYVLLAYEDDEKKAQSWFKAAWEALHSGEKTISQRINVHLVTLSAAISQVLARVYGARLFSLRVPAAQVTLMMASAFVAGGVVTMAGKTTVLEVSLAERAMGLFWWALAALWLLAAWARNGQWVVFCAALVVVPLGIGATAEPSDHVLQLTLLMLFAFGVDLAVTSVVRKMLASVSLDDALRRTAWRLMVATLVAPVLVAVAVGIPHLLSAAAALEEVLPGWTYFLLLACAIALLTSALLVIAVAASTVYRIGYAIAPRAVHSFAIRFKVLENRKAAAALGIVLISPLVPTFAPWMEKVTKALTA